MEKLEIRNPGASGGKSKSKQRQPGRAPRLSMAPRAALNDPAEGKTRLGPKLYEREMENKRTLSNTSIFGCLQDVWNSVGCFGDDYHTISKDTGGAWHPLMTCSRCVNRFCIDFSLIFHCFQGKSMKIK